MAGLLDVLSSDGREPAEALPLPSVAMHSYLPSSSERPSIAEQVRTIAPEQIRQNEIPLIPLDGVVLYPGETLPLRIRGEAKKRLVSELYREGPVESTPKASNAADGTAATPKLGVLLRPQHRSYGDLWCVHKVGTFVDVMSISHPAVNEGEDTEVVVVCRGATRFKVVSPPCRRRGVLWAPVALMADSRLPPFHQVLPRGPRFCRNSAKLWRKHSSGVGEPPARESLKLVTRHEQLPRYELTFHSSWLWRAQCPWVLQARAKSLLLSTAAWRGIGNSATHSSSYNHHHRSGDNSLSVSDDDDDNNNINSSGGATDSGPRSSNKLVADANDISNPVGFSYWMARNLPLNDATRQELLAAPSVVHRLKQILTIVEASANSRLVCQNCGTAVGAKSAVFAVTGAEGTVGAYVNPHGIVHQTVTLREVFNVLLHGPVGGHLNVNCRYGHSFLQPGAFCGLRKTYP